MKDGIIQGANLAGLVGRFIHQRFWADRASLHDVFAEPYRLLIPYFDRCAKQLCMAVLWVLAFRGLGPSCCPLR